MKKQHLIALLLLPFLLSACNWECDSPMIWDILPVEIYVTPVDKAGNNLLENGKLDLDKIVIVAKGQKMGVYPLGEVKRLKREAWENGKRSMDAVKPRPAPTRAYGPVIFHGAEVRKLQSGELAIVIGEYDGDSNYDKEAIHITWPSGQKSLIEFTRKVSYKGRCGEKLKVTQKRFLNGKRVEENPIRVVVE